MAEIGGIINKLIHINISIIPNFIQESRDRDKVNLGLEMRTYRNSKKKTV